MAKRSISIYSFRIKNRGNNQYYNLNDLGSGNTAISIVNNYISNNNQTYIKNNSLKKIFRFCDERSYTYSNTSNIEIFEMSYGKVKTGEYGVISEIIDSDTGDMNYNKTQNEADVMPFSYCITVPRGNITYGLLILENIGSYGVKTILSDSLIKHFKDINIEYEVLIKPIAPTEYIDRCLNNGILKKISLLKYNLPNDPVNRMQQDMGVRGSIDEYVIHKPVGDIPSLVGRVGNFLRNGLTINNVIQIDDFEYHNIKLSVDLNGRSKTIDLGNLDKIVIKEELDNQVIFRDGHPSLDSMRTVFINSSTEYLEAMGLI